MCFFPPTNWRGPKSKDVLEDVGVGGGWKGGGGGGAASDRPTDAALPHSKTVFKWVAIGNISSRPYIV